MPKHPVKMNGGSLTRQILFPIDKSTITNTALRSVTESRPAGQNVRLSRSTPCCIKMFSPATFLPSKFVIGGLPGLILRTNTALRSVTESRPAGKMPALPAPLSSNVFVGEAIRWPGECCYRGESANLSAYGGDRV